MRISDWSSDVCSSDLIATLLEKGVSEEEVAAAKKRLVAGAVYARDNLSTAPRVIGAALTTGGSLEQVESWPERLETVTAAEVNAALESEIGSASCRDSGCVYV